MAKWRSKPASADRSNRGTTGQPASWGSGDEPGRRRVGTDIHQPRDRVPQGWRSGDRNQPAQIGAIVELLASQHHGVLAMSPDVAGLVQTSTNLAIVSLKDGEVEIETSQRSPIESSKLAAGRMVSTVFRMAHFEV